MESQAQLPSFGQPQNPPKPGFFGARHNSITHESVNAFECQEKEIEKDISMISLRKIVGPKPKNKIKEMDNDDGGSDNEEKFIAHPADDLPKNRLIEQFAKGLTVYVQRMMKRHSYFVSVKKMDTTMYTPAPRELQQIIFNKDKTYVIGGLNHGVEDKFYQLDLENHDGDDLDDLK